MAYLTIELKTNDKGGTAAEVLYSGTDLKVAEQKYYQTLATAATSNRPRHACVILDSDGMTLAQRSYVVEQGVA
jgi:hypothetical protein